MPPGMQTRASMSAAPPSAPSAGSASANHLSIPMSEFFAPCWGGEVAGKACRKFLCEVGQYRSRGGSTPLWQLIHEDVQLDLVGDSRAADLGQPLAQNQPGDEFIQRPHQAFALPPPKQAQGTLKPLAMKPGKQPSPQAPRDYNREFKRVCQQMSSGNQLEDEQMLRVYAQGLQPKMLRDELSARPKGVSLGDACFTAFKIMKGIIRYTPVDTTSNPKGNSGKGSSGQQGSQEPGAEVPQEIICHWCGTPGHKKPKCPNLGKPRTYDPKSQPKVPAKSIAPAQSRRVIAQTDPNAPDIIVYGNTVDEIPSLIEESEEECDDAPGDEFEGASGIVDDSEVPGNVNTCAAPAEAVTRRSNMSNQSIVSPPRVEITLKGPSGSVQVKALLDSGSNVNWIRPDIVSAIGAIPRGLSAVSVQAHDSIVQASQEVDVNLELSAGVMRPTIFPFSAFLSDSADNEEAIIGYSWQTEYDLKHLPDIVDDEGNGDLQNFVQSYDENVDPISSGEVFHTGPELKQHIDALVHQYSDLFQVPSEPANVKPFTLELSDQATQLPISKSRCFAPAIQHEIDSQIQEFAQLGIIEPSHSPSAAPIVPVRKPDGSMRVCVDFRKVNECTKRDAYPMPDARETVTNLSGNKYFARLDLWKGFHQIPVAESDREFLAFRNKQELWQFKRMPFGVKNGSAAFQRMMNDAIESMSQAKHARASKYLSVFIDDVGIHAPDAESYIATLHAFFDLCRAKKLRLKKSKCVFNLKVMEYVGFIADTNGYTLTDARRQGLADMPEPRTAKMLRAVLGVANFFRPFVPNFSRLAAPLAAMLRKGAKFVWPPQSAHAFKQLKAACLDCAVLSFPSNDLPLIVQADASTVGTGAALLQPESMEADAKLLPIAFLSRKLNSTQQNWSTIEQKAFAIYDAIIKWDHFLAGRHFEVQTDHRNLKWMFTSNTPKVLRWRLALDEYDFTVKHIAGKSNILADGFSRYHDCSPVTRVTVIDPNDPVLSLDQQTQSVHNPVVGHLGIHATCQKLAEKGIEVNSTVRSVVSKFISECAICQKTRRRQIPVTAALHTTCVEQPFLHLYVDTIGPLPEDFRGNKYIVVIIDAFTRFTEVIPMPDPSAESAADASLLVIGRYGKPTSLSSDRGTQFTADTIEALCNLLGVNQSFGIPYRPQSQGKVERVNAEVMRHLRCLLLQRKTNDQWSRFLPLAQRIVNSMVHRVTGIAPSKMLYGDAIDLSRHIITDPIQPDPPVVTPADYVSNLIDAQRSYVRQAVILQNHHIEKYLSKSPTDPTTFAIGTSVLVNYPERPPSKLLPRWRGPFVITSVSGDIYTCKSVLSNKEEDFHIDRLQLFSSDPKVSDEEVATWDQASYLVDSIIDHSGTPKKRAKMRFLVRWLGFGPGADTWEDYSNVKHTEAFTQYAQLKNLKF